MNFLQEGVPAGRGHRPRATAYGFKCLYGLLRFAPRKRILFGFLRTDIESADDSKKGEGGLEYSFGIDPVFMS